ncbi:DoxX family protein [Desertivirga xinjiangensis]|uniref:DoxX family protein n=1 Tax=Desertivirga xinjiangensis TaxID=539206 RepID=UPI002109E17A|nr:DoxX family protein [Pedobacter xinjiangensis]
MKSKFLSGSAISYDLGLLIIRLFTGGLMLTHGFPKLQKLVAGNLQFGDPLGVGQEISLVLAVFAEFVCSILVILGLFTRVAVIPLIITMAVAFFIVHSADPLQVKELSLVYLAVFAGLFFTGSGKYSIDRKR